MVLPAHSGPRPLIQFRNHFSHTVGLPWTSDQPVARQLPKHRTTQTQIKRIRTPNINALNGIRTHDPSVRASEDSPCGYCDRHSNYTWRRVQAMKRLIIQFSPTSYHFISLRSKYSPQYPGLTQKIWYRRESNPGPLDL
jgi:hypothetical protein